MLKKRSGKLLIVLIISILMFNFIGSNVVMANGTDITKVPNTTTTTTTQSNAVKDLNLPNTSDLDAEMAIAQKIDYSALGILLDGYVGYRTYLQKVLLVVVGGVLQFLATMVGESAGTTEESGSYSITMVSVEDILFNKLAITDVNFFNINTFGATNKTLEGANNPIKSLKESVASWYMTLRTISIIILLAVLIYIGIRMAMSSVASEKAEYKKMFMNWVVSLALVFLLHYIILAALAINNTLVNIIANIGEKMLNTDRMFFSNYLSKMVLNCFNPLATIGWSYTFTYLAIVTLTFVFLIMYIKRMLTIAFLILIAPIITITYSIDKVGDGKAQAFSAWFKELMHNIFIQPFHCLIFLAFTSVAIKMLQHYGTLAATVLVILSMVFILLSEKIIKKIFGIDSESTGNGLATALVLRSAYGKLSTKKPSVPTNGAIAAAGAGAAAASVAKTNAKAPSMGATSNMAAVNANNNTTQSGTSGQTYYNSQNLNQKLSGGQAHVIDHEDLKNGDDGSQRINETLSNNIAYADDYEELMKNPNPTQNNQTQAPKVNKVYGVLGTQPGQQTQTKVAQQPDKSTAEKAWDLTKKGVKAFNDHQWNGGLAGAVMGATLSAVAGADIAETIGSTGVGRKAQIAMQANAENMIAEKRMEWEKHLREIDIRENDRNLASSFRDYKDGEAYNKNADIQKTRDYLNMTHDEVNNMPDKEAQKFVQSLHATRELYANTYTEEDINEKVIETMEKIIDKKIEPVD